MELRIILLCSSLHLLMILPSSRQGEIENGLPGNDSSSREDIQDVQDDDDGRSPMGDWEIYSSEDIYEETLHAGGNQTEIKIDENDSKLGPFILADTKLGRVRGRKKTSRIGRTFYQFKGLPYAQPPTGNLRFEAPLPSRGWDGIRDATSFRPQCLQVNIVTQQIMGNEDCLYLNVYTRKAYTKDEMGSVPDRSLSPVIVFIHGGLFMFGGSTPFGGKYFLDEDVVLVTLNYRLASFGFLNIGNSLIPGNMGLKDQVMALRWVQNNIRYFNGDPRRVTLLGESAGAVSVHLHTLSPMSRGLFSGAISQSGTALSPWGLMREPVAQSKEFADGLGCPSDGSLRMVNCLKGLSGRKIARFHRGYIRALAEEKLSLYAPTVEARHKGKSFMPKSPLKLLKRGRISETPWITGVNSGEGLVQLIPIIRSEKLRNALNSRWDQLAPTFLSLQHHRKKSLLISDVKEHYLQDQPISPSNILKAVEMISDRNFFLDNHDAAILQSRGAPTYVYHYSYEGRFAIGNLLFSKTVLPLPDDINYMTGSGLNWMGMMMGLMRRSKLGVCHGDEIPLMFNMLVRGEVHKFDVDFNFSRKLIKLWVSFAESGVPDTRQSAGESVTWEPVRQSNRDLRDVPLKYLSIDKQFSIIHEPFNDGLQFWKNHSISYL